MFCFENPSPLFFPPLTLLIPKFFFLFYANLALYCNGINHCFHIRFLSHLILLWEVCQPVMRIITKMEQTTMHHMTKKYSYLVVAREYPFSLYLFHRLVFSFLKLLRETILLNYDQLKLCLYYTCYFITTLIIFLCVYYKGCLIQTISTQHF